MNAVSIPATKRPNASRPRHEPGGRRLILAGRRGLSAIPLYVPMCIAAVFFVLPFVWMVSGAFKSPSEILTFPPKLIPRHGTTANFSVATDTIPLGRYFFNSAFIAIVSTVGAVACSALAGFGFAHVRGRGRNIWFGILLATMMIPYYVTIIPTFSLYESLGWLNTYLPLTVPAFLGVGGGFYIFLMRQFFLGIPRDLFEAARIDGASLFRCFWQVALPLAKPALITVALFQFVASWNDFFGPLVYLSDSKMYTLPVAIRFFQGLHNSDFGPMMAMTCLTVLPVLLLFLTAQRFFVQGIATTGTTG